MSFEKIQKELGMPLFLVTRFFGSYTHFPRFLKKSSINELYQIFIWVLYTFGSIRLSN